MKPIKIDVIYEDEDILVVNKPSGCLVLPDRIKSEDWNIKAHFEKQYPNIFIVHRIDRDTSGVLILAKMLLRTSTSPFSFRSENSQELHRSRAWENASQGSDAYIKIAENKAHRGRYLIHKSGIGCNHPLSNHRRI
ncbi:MAG: hypothetical protein IPK03_08480 [Bacteroidetes bacterium]|nr:hypothetical protein [Bacteroidota bacterium]